MLHRSLCLEGEVLKLTLKYSYLSVLNVHIKSFGERDYESSGQPSMVRVTFCVDSNDLLLLFFKAHFVSSWFLKLASEFPNNSSIAIYGLAAATE